MSDEQKYTIQGLEEYIRQGEPQQRERGETWKVAIGLQQVDGLTPSEYLLDTAKRHIEGDISIGEAKMLIDSYYKSAAGRKEVENDRTEEADKVSARITEILAEKLSLSLQPSLPPFTVGCLRAFTSKLAEFVTIISPKTSGCWVVKPYITQVPIRSAKHSITTWGKNVLLIMQT